ncbi:MAG: gamma-glutamyl-gamma-aminobutyrate hydrolase family protein [Holophagaceae bacterium]|nr:gamma-glutamyl-gamma-aminobutyrate hydrolase family protein [Holophagaceae bacterium]
MKLLVTCRDKESLFRTYVPAIRQGGWEGSLEVLTPGDLHNSLDDVAGLLLSGGGDIHPRNWDINEQLHPAAEVDEERDSMEIPLIQGAWDRNLPIFGICRGEQVLNVALGGSLIQDIPCHYGCDSQTHSHGDNKTPELHHFVKINPGSRLANILGQNQVQVNSRHHQAVASIAPSLVATGWHDETQKNGKSLIEAVEAKDPNRWALGVQWHPENLVALEGDAGRAARELFRHFVFAVNAIHAEQGPSC